MDTFTRREVYLRDNRPLTPRQRRRLIKKAGRDPYAVIGRDNGMGYPPSMQGFKELIGCDPAPAADAGRGHEAVEAWIDEATQAEPT